ncbi:DUF3846 domain-containing protein [Mycolicibacterium canariasense]|uniref:DUF3846 domain-containing protein n=1 Tax=Mycolicibacterium canariasense TaxID=228230 RepID=UPI0032D5A682
MSLVKALVLTPYDQQLPNLPIVTIDTDNGGLRAIVGGWLEHIYGELGGDEVTVIVNEEGLKWGLPPNRLASSLIRELAPPEQSNLIGTAVVVGLKDDEYIDVTDQVIEWYRSVSQQ